MSDRGTGSRTGAARLADEAPRRTFVFLLGLIVTSLLVSFTARAGAAGVTRIERVSVSSVDEQSDTDSLLPALAGAGRFVVFQSSSDLLDGPTGGFVNVFIRDTVSGETKCVTRGIDAGAPNGDSTSASVSGDGRYVAFASDASNLVAGDDNGCTDVFVTDMVTGETDMVSVTPGMAGGNADSHSPSISADGSSVAFVSGASDLVTADRAGHDDVFVRDLVAAQTVRVSRGTGVAEANGHSAAPSISADGHAVAFSSFATNLVAGGDNGRSDVYVANLSGASVSMVRASASASGVEGNLGSYGPSIDAAGRRVAFESQASNLVAGDTNGVRDVFVADVVSRFVTRASVSASGAQLTAASRDAAIDPITGRVAFTSASQAVVPGDTNGVSDVFLYEPSTRSVSRLSVTATGAEAEGASSGCRFASDGSAVGFHSFAENIVGPDNNQRADVFVVKTAPRVYERLSGRSRYATAVEASKHAYPATAPAAVIATGENWPDALSGSALAGVAGGPLLLTEGRRLTSETRAEIVRLAPKTVYVLGGVNSVSAGVEAELKQLLGVSNVVRLSGQDRYATSVAIANKVIALQNGAFDGTVLVATGANYPDALAGSPVAASAARPIVLANPATARFTLPGVAQRAVVLGGPVAVPAAVESSLKARLGSGNVTRLGGANRYATAVLIAGWGVSDAGLAWHGVTLATGEKFPDALSGGVMAGALDTVILLTQRSVLPSTSSGQLSAAAGGIGEVHVLGGEASVDAQVMSAVKRACGD